MSLGFSRGFRFALYGLAVFILAASMYALAKPKHVGDVPPMNEDDHILGVQEAPKVTLIEYSDFQCPGCAGMHPVIKQILATYPNDIQFVYRHFPLMSIHANAEAAAFASEAAAMQGKFWEMHDILFDRQEDWGKLLDPSAIFIAYAEILELDVNQFTTDMQSDNVRERVHRDIASGNTAGISSTPTIYLNGTALVFPKNTPPFAYLTSQIDATIAVAQEQPAPETPPTP